jgi:hypothetical protein
VRRERLSNLASQSEREKSWPSCARPDSSLTQQLEPWRQARRELESLALTSFTSLRFILVLEAKEGNGGGGCESGLARSSLLGGAVVKASDEREQREEKAGQEQVSRQRSLSSVRSEQGAVKNRNQIDPYGSIMALFPLSESFKTRRVPSQHRPVGGSSTSLAHRTQRILWVECSSVELKRLQACCIARLHGRATLEVRDSPRVELAAVAKLQSQRKVSIASRPIRE